MNGSSKRLWMDAIFWKIFFNANVPDSPGTQETADALLAAGFKYGRTVENVSDVSKYQHPMILHSNCHFQDQQFYDLYKKAKTDGCKYFYFWGHSYEMQDSEGMWKQLEDKIEYITDDPDAVWCDVIDIVTK